LVIQPQHNPVVSQVLGYITECMTAQVNTNSKHRIIEIIDRYAILIEELYWELFLV